MPRTEPTEAARYRFGPLEKRGFIAGWRAGQVGLVTLGLVAAVGVLRIGHPPIDLAEALGCVLGAVAAASWPIAGRTCDQWCPVVAAWLFRRGSGGHRHISSVPVLGRPAVAAREGGGRPVPVRRASLPARRPVPVRRASLPVTLSGCRLLAPPTPVGGLRLGVILDTRARTYTGVVAVSGAAFALLETEERHRRVAAWSSLLASLARDTSPIHRLQWVERDLPGEPSELLQRTEAAMVLPQSAPAAQSYAEVVQRAGRLARSHQVLLALSIRADRATREIRAFGGGDEGACTLLSQELRSLASALTGAEVLVQGALSPTVLALTLRQAFDPSPVGLSGSAAENRAEDPSEHPRAVPGDPVPAWGSGHSWPWPLASQTSWSTHRTEQTWHATYWVAEWPRMDIGPDFLAPLLLHSGVRHTMAVTMEPISPLKAARSVAHARTADLADAELRRRGGYLTSARRSREAEAVSRRGTELADGHAEYRFSGYVTVTAGSAEALVTDCMRMEQAAGRAHLELRRLFGQQDEAFTWTLPMGRGLA
ncbi:MAG: SCO6880 family protein [Acidimicrobiales bacterium]